MLHKVGYLYFTLDYLSLPHILHLAQSRTARDYNVLNVQNIDIHTNKYYHTNESCILVINKFKVRLSYT